MLHLMWWIEYEDYKPDRPLIKDEVGPLQGIVGCEMHDLNGWGGDYHVYRKPRGQFRHMIDLLFRIPDDERTP